MTEFVFYLSLFLILYTYLGYPLFLLIVSRFVNRPVIRGNILPSVTIVIPVHNEENQIRAKIENCLKIDYPKDELKIIVASDYSTDRTEDIVKEFESEQLQFLQLPFRGGKVAAQNYAVRFGESDIFVFTDVAIRIDQDCIKLIVQNFHDGDIGVVSCRDVVIGDNDRKEGERSYINYDMLVRKYTSQIGSIIGVTGGFYAVRKEVAQGGWNPAFPPDFYVALRSIKRGMRVVEDSRVKAYYKTAAEEWDELTRKARTINRGMRALFWNRGLLNPFKYGLISLELASHKLFRWMTPFFFLLLFFSNLIILKESVFAIWFFIIQLCFYSLVIISVLVKKEASDRFFRKLPSFFLVVNLAILKAWVEFIIGKKYVIWEPTKR